jgi:hypothetical protein
MADKLIVSQYCFTLACTNSGTWHTNYGTHYFIDADDGCRDTDVPAMYQLCMDYSKGRGHFFFEGQGKRCLKETSNDWAHCSDDFQFATCTTIYYDEVPCTW